MTIEDNFEMANSEQQTTSANGNGKRNKLMIVVLVVLGIIGVFFGVRWLMFHLAYTSTDDAQIDADLIPAASKVSGRLVKTYVLEGDKVRAGQIIAQIDPTDYELALKQAEARLESTRHDLEKAQASLELTDTKNQIAVKQTATSLNQAWGGVEISSTQQSVNLEKLQKDLERAQINQQRADEHYKEVKAAADQAQTDLDRSEKLYVGGVISKEQLDKARTNAETAKTRLAQVDQEVSDAEKQVEIATNNLHTAQIDSVRTDIAVQDKEKTGLSLVLTKKQQYEEKKIALSTVEGLKYQITALENVVEQTRIALNETRILSPVNGIVSRKISLEGQIVPAGQPIFFVVNTSDLHVFANIEETNINKIVIGCKANITVDALPGKIFHGVVTSIGSTTNSKYNLIPTSSASGQFIKTTQRVLVKIRLLDTLSDDIKPGLNVVVHIKNRK